MSSIQKQVDEYKKSISDARKRGEEVRQKAKAAGTWGVTGGTVKTDPKDKPISIDDILNIGENTTKKSPTPVSEKRQMMQKIKEDASAAPVLTETERRAQEAKSALENYMASEERAALYEQRQQKHKDDLLANTLLYGTDAAVPEMEADETEDRLRAESAYWEQQAVQEHDQNVMAKGLQEIAEWSDEDRAALERYAVDKENEFYNISGSDGTGAVFGIANQQAEPLFQKYGRDKVQQLSETYLRYMNQQRAQDVQEQGRQAAGDSAVGGVIKSLPTVPLNLITTGAGAWDAALQDQTRTGQYKTLDPYSRGNTTAIYSQAMRGKAAQNIAGDVYDEQGNLVKEGGKVRELASLAYQGGMSAADNLARVAAASATGGGSLVAVGLAATQSFENTLRDASARGVPPDQAVALAAVNSGIEALTEKLPLDNLMSIAKTGGKPAAKLIQNMLVQAGIEATEEEVSLIATTLAEAAILKDSGSYSQQIAQAVANGMTMEEARAQADADFLEEAKTTAIVSGFSGGMGAATASAAGNARTGRQNQQVQTEQTTQQQEQAAPVQEQAAEMEAETAEPDADLTEQGGLFEGLLQEQEDQRAAADDAWMRQTFADMEEAKARAAEMQRANEERSETKKRQQEVYEDLKAAQREQTRLEKDIAKAEQKLKETGKGSQARIDQMKAQLEQQRNLVAQIESQNEYFAGDYERTVEEAIARQETVLQNARAAAQKAIADHEAGLITDAQLASANETYNRAGAELSRLSNMTQEQYRAELAEVGLVADLAPREAVAGRSVPAATAATEQAPQQTQTQAQQTAQESSQTAQTAPQQAQAETKSTEDIITETITGKPAQAPQASTQQTDTAAETPAQQVQSAEGGQARDTRASNTYMNTGIRSQNENIREGYREDLKSDPELAKYAVKHNADTLAEATERVSTPEKASAALDDLLSRSNWTAEDVATSTLLLDQIMASGDKEAKAKLAGLRQMRKNVGVGAGQVSQAFGIHNPTMRAAATPATAVDSFRSALDSMKESETTHSKKSGVDFETWKENIKNEVDNIAIAVATVEDGDSAGMRNIITQIARARKTTAMFGTSSNLTGRAMAVLNKLDFDDLKKIANTQIAAMADDYRKRSGKQIVGGVRKQAMLSSLKTFVRNLGGNTAGGIADAVSESGAGRLADSILSNYTGKRTVGNDFSRGREYMRGAKDAGNFASLCVELNIPIESDVDSSFSVASGRDGNTKYIGKTFRATGNPAMRALYAYQKYMSYALEVTDKIFEGGTNAAVTESLNRLKNSGLTEEDVGALSQFTANKRTFKKATWQEDGKTRGSAMARKGTQLKNATGIFGEIAAPFVDVPMNVAQTGIDYTAGTAKGIAEMVSIIKDVKAGKTIPVERQRQAASDFGRGITGTAMIGMFAAAAAMGALRVADDSDWDKEALSQAEGRTGAQINWSALERGTNGESAEWQTSDIISTVDFLEPFNTQMYLGWEMAQDEDMNALKYAGATIKSVWNSIMDSPMMSGLSEIEETLSDLNEAETAQDVANIAAEYAGGVATSFVPQFVRQTAQYMDGYYRDTRGATAAETAVNRIKTSIPGMSQELPVKYSGLGEVQKRGSALEIFVDPTATKTFERNEVTTYLDRLHEETGDAAIYPDRQAPMKITVNGREIQMDGATRETYQKTYGDSVNSLYGELIKNGDFLSMSADQQNDALITAKEYAQGYAKAAVSEYRETQDGTPEEVAARIVTKTMAGTFTAAIKELKTAEEYGYDETEPRESIGWAYDTFKGLSKSAQEAVFDEGGTIADYIEARQNQITNDQFWDVENLLDGIKPERGKDDPRAVQKAEAIAGAAGLTDRERFTLIRQQVSDSQIENIDQLEELYKTEKDLRDKTFTPKRYAELYRDVEDYTSLDGKKGRTTKMWVQKYGISLQTARKLYEVFK